MAEDAQITALLNDWANGSSAALEALSPLIYDELKKFARRAFSREGGGHTLQPTALVNEVFIKLVDNDVSWQSRAHFYALAARMMRRLLINYANERNAGKRGGDFARIEYDETQLAGEGDQDENADLFALNTALASLSEVDTRKAELIELQYFAGLSYQEMSAVTGLSSSTLDRELRFAKAWLKKQLGEN